MSILNDAEESNDLLLYVCDTWANPSRWTKLCVQQADVVLLVANAADPPRRSPLEANLTPVMEAANARRELVLLHVQHGDDGGGASSPYARAHTRAHTTCTPHASCMHAHARRHTRRTRVHTWTLTCAHARAHGTRAYAFSARRCAANTRRSRSPRARCSRWRAT